MSVETTVIVRCDCCGHKVEGTLYSLNIGTMPVDNRKTGGTRTTKIYEKDLCGNCYESIIGCITPSATFKKPRINKRHSNVKHDWDRAEQLRAEGMSYAQIAKELGIPKGSVCSHFFKVKEKPTKKEDVVTSFGKVIPRDEGELIIEQKLKESYNDSII